MDHRPRAEASMEDLKSRGSMLYQYLTFGEGPSIHMFILRTGDPSASRRHLLLVLSQSRNQDSLSPPPIARRATH